MTTQEAIEWLKRELLMTGIRNKPKAAAIEFILAALRERQAVGELVEAARHVFRVEPDLDGDDAPGHAHSKPGFWDWSSKQCDLCQAWMKFREALAKFDAPREGADAAS